MYILTGFYKETINKSTEIILWINEQTANPLRCRDWQNVLPPGEKIRATREQGETETIESPSNQSYVKQEQRSRGRRVEDQY